MFDFGLSELMFIGVIALIVLGPERLPQAARTAGNLVGKLQRLVSSVKQELSVQAELDDLRKAKQEFESAAHQLQDELKTAGNEAQSNLNEISDGLKPWERLPAQHTPADFGVDENGLPLNENHAGAAAQTAAPLETSGAETNNAETAADPDQAWRDYLTGTAQTSASEISYTEIAPAAPQTAMHTASLRKQAMQRKRDARPKLQAKPKLRLRKK